MSQNELGGYSERVLSLIAWIVSGEEVRVVVTDRVSSAGAVGMEGRAVFLNPAQAGLYDLFVAATLLRRRRAVKQEWKHADRVPSQVVQRWVGEARQRLTEPYPGLIRLPGALHPDAPDPGSLEVVWSKVSFDPLGALGGRLGSALVPGVDVSGPDDLRRLAEGLASGEIETERRPELPELPVAVVPLRLTTPASIPATWERIQQDLSIVAPNAQSMARCVTEKTLGNLPWETAPRRLRAGLRLDTSRLHEVALAARTGLAPAVFTRRDDRFQDVFDPTRHLTVLAFDFSALESGSTLSGRGGLSRFVLFVMARAMEHVGADCIVIGTADRLMTLADDRRVYLHAPFVLKTIDEPFDHAFYARIDEATRLRRSGLGEPALFHPFLLQDVAKHIDEAASRTHYRTLHVHLIGPRGLGAPDLETETFLRREAETIDAIFDALIARHGGLWSGQQCAPRELIRAAPPGSHTADMFSL